jgi:hypothetical protein
MPWQGGASVLSLTLLYNGCHSERSESRVRETRPRRVPGRKSLSFPTTAGLRPFAEFILSPAEGFRVTGRQAVKAFL